MRTSVSVPGRTTVHALPLLLYTGSVVILSLALAGQPPFLYNWEEYTVWKLMPGLADPARALLASLRLNDGLMTNSGETPVVLAPLLLLTSLFGPDLLTLRVFPVAFTSLAVPLVYLVGLEVYDRQTALLAAAFTATSACFALYARTATNVGISLVPALLTLWLWLRWQRRPSPEIAFLLGLLFVAEAYFYATTRFLVLLAVPLVAVTLWRQRPASALTQAGLVFLPLVLFLAWQRPAAPPVLGSLLSYYNGRGEQIVTMYAQAGDAGAVAGAPPSLAAWLPESVDPRLKATLALLAGNAEHMTNLFLSYDTTSSFTDFWNSKGRLYHPFLMPFFLAGLALALRGWRKRGNATVLLVLFGVSLPILLTSNVHAGRLLLALPPILLLAARGWTATMADLDSGWRQPGWVKLGWLVSLGTVLLAIGWGILRPGSWWPAAPVFVVALTMALVLLPGLVRRQVATGATALAVLAILAAGAWQEYTFPPPPHYVYELAAQLRGLPGDGPVLLVSRRSDSALGEMEASSLAFYLRHDYSVQPGVPADWSTRASQRLLYDVAGYAQRPEVVPTALPPNVTLAVDREVGQEAVDRLTRQFGQRLVLVP
ncbi:MAG: glycosyltransferase family 39 protein [Chloroflexi bacterium]|nr:glycosyltransferase family 39 protein [Chloroflexota bacterium]